jgi:hypothetical protein
MRQKLIQRFIGCVTFVLFSTHVAKQGGGVFTDNQGMNVGRSVQHPCVAMQLGSQEEEGCICFHSVTHRYYRDPL